MKRLCLLALMPVCVFSNVLDTTLCVFSKQRVPLALSSASGLGVYGFSKWRGYQRPKLTVLAAAGTAALVGWFFWERSTMLDVRQGVVRIHQGLGDISQLIDKRSGMVNHLSQLVDKRFDKVDHSLLPAQHNIDLIQKDLGIIKEQVGAAATKEDTLACATTLDACSNNADPYLEILKLIAMKMNIESEICPL